MTDNPAFTTPVPTLVQLIGVIEEYSQRVTAVAVKYQVMVAEKNQSRLELKEMPGKFL
jgi:hypothetical protein